MRAKKIIVVLSVCLAACAPLKPALEAPENKKMPIEARKKQTSKVSAWDIKGAMSAKYKNNGWSASLNWHQQGANNYKLRLFGPLGGGSVVISKHGQVVTYQDGADKESSTNAAQLLQRKTGIKLPVNNLYFWVRGISAPGSVQAASYDEYNHLKTLKQAGYTINYVRYTSVNGTDLPSKISLQGHGVSIKLVIKSWTL